MRKFTTVINHTTILCDLRTFRASLNDQHMIVRGMANRHFWGSTSGLARDEGPHGSGTLIGGNLLHIYHIASVARGIWIVSNMKELTVSQTKPIALKYIS